ncbi:hypothetical protein [Kribbella sancticallisti]
MIDDNRTLPAVLVEAHQEGFDYRSGAGIDFEPFAEFISASETAEWWRAWTGNASLDGAEFLLFGRDGTGGMAAFWRVREGEPLGHQPVVFLGSEGETGVVARDLNSYLWLLASGFGPFEASRYPEHEHEPQADARLTRLAQRYAASEQQSTADVITAARTEFPRFDDTIDRLCR